MRDINKAVQRGREIIKKKNRIDLTASEITMFEERIRAGEDPYDVIHGVFLAGVAIGARNAK